MRCAAIWWRKIRSRPSQRRKADFSRQDQTWTNEAVIFLGHKKLKEQNGCRAPMQWKDSPKRKRWVCLCLRICARKRWKETALVAQTVITDQHSIWILQFVPIVSEQHMRFVERHKGWSTKTLWLLYSYFGLETFPFSSLVLVVHYAAIKGSGVISQKCHCAEWHFA